MKTLVKSLFLSAAFVFILFFLDMPIFAAEIPEYIRVGLEYKYKNVSSVPVSDKNISFGIEYNEKYFEETVFSSNSGFLVSSGSGFYVDLNKSYDNYSDAFYASQSYGSLSNPAVPVYFGKEDWGVYIAGFSSQNSALGSAGNYGGMVVSASESIKLEGSSETLLISKVNFQIEPYSGEALTLGDRSYRGRIEFYISASSVTAVNVIALEEYLYSVVPSEMPKTYEEEALKAQACAARTYTISKLGAYAENGYDICDGESSQIYKGFSNEAEATTRAVDATAGEIIYYNNSPINAVFFSSSGGYTDNSENVWYSEVPYLKAVSDTYEYDTKIWERSYDKSDIQELAVASGSSIGKVTDMYISKASSSGRVQELVISGTNGSITLTKEKIRTFFASNGGSLESRLFTVNGETPAVSSGNISSGDVYAISAAGVATKLSLSEIYVINENGSSIEKLASSLFKLGKSGIISALQSTSASYNNINEQNYAKTSLTGDFILNGVGYGHGVGMSQKGANGMAKAGFDYINILTHYYTGVSVY